MLKQVKKIKRAIKLDYAYEIQSGRWLAESENRYLMFLYFEGMLYMANDERQDNLKSKLDLIATNSNPIEKIRLKDILDLLEWECADYYEGDG